MVYSVLPDSKKVISFSTLHTFTVFPDDMNYAGALFGGKILAEIDIAASTTARKLLYGVECDGVVTASLDRVDFKRPARLGDIIEMNSKVVRLGRSSIVVRTNVMREDQRGEREQICEAFFTFVCVKDGSPMAHGFELLEEE